MSDEMSPHTKAAANAVIVDLQREVSKLKDERADWEDDLHRVTGERDESRARVRQLEGERMRLCEGIRWIVQTVHQAHGHEGDIWSCPKNTCSHARELLHPDFGPDPRDPPPGDPF